MVRKKVSFKGSSKKEQKAVDEVMAEAKEDKPVSVASAANLPQELEDDEAHRKAVRPQNKFQVVELKGGRFRVMGKRGEWISPVLNATEANRLASRFNLKDPEQKIYNVRPGIWNEGNRVQ